MTEQAMEVKIRELIEEQLIVTMKLTENNYRKIEHLQARFLDLETNFSSADVHLREMPNVMRTVTKISNEFYVKSNEFSMVKANLQAINVRITNN